LTSAAAHTNFGPSSASLFGAMEFDSNGVLYCIAVAVGSPLQKLDTTTGALTSLGSITGIASEQVLGMSFNPVNNKMYITTITAGLDNLYTLDLTTRVATLVGSTGQNFLFDISFNSTGACYGISVADNLISINPVTGYGTIVGPIGFDANFIQGICFDRFTDTLWYAAYNNTAGAGQLRTVNLTTGATTLIGAFSPSAEICGFTIAGKKAFPLSAFNLLTPAAGVRVVTVAGSTTPVTITWDTSASDAAYKWIFGNPVVLPRRLTLPSSTNSINTSLGALDSILAANGFTNNGSATDSAVGQWDIWAFKSPIVSGPDSLNSSNGPREITLRRQKVPLKIKLTTLFEGKYNATFELMSKRDTVSIYLRTVISPYTIIDSAKGVIDSLSFSNLFSFTNALSGYYYIVIKHKQCLETWSKSGGEYLIGGNEVYNFDFSTANTQAYGNNLILKGSKYCLYNGDVNQDGHITLFDVIPIYNDAINFVTGRYIITDLTGDNIVDLTDVTLCYNNSSNFVRIRRP